MSKYLSISTKAPKNLNKEKIKAKTAKLLEELNELQNLLFAENIQVTRKKITCILYRETEREREKNKSSELLLLLFY